MADELKPGAHVEWDTSQGTTQGTLERKLAHRSTAKTSAVKTSAVKQPAANKFAAARPR